MTGGARPTRILISAYACEPGRGSEPGVGWNWVRQLARRNQVWVITRRNNRPAIESELGRHPLPNATFVYYDLPDWARFWKRRRQGLYLYYYLWQIGVYLTGRRLHRQIGFDLVHHATFVMYWMPSFLALLDVPFIWGPVGGGEAAPRGFPRSWHERLRAAAQAVGRLDPFVRMTARRAALALATTPETESRLRELGCRKTAVLPVMALDTECPDAWRDRRPAGPLRIASMGKLIAWKGVQMGLDAFHAANLPASELWIIGDGPERKRLEKSAGPQVRFFGELPRPEALARLAECDVLLHPSLHDSGACVITEAMALGKPVVCLALGGPALQVTRETGIAVAALTPGQAVADLTAALRTLGQDPQLRRQMGEAARRRVAGHMSWDAKGRAFEELCVA